MKITTMKIKTFFTAITLALALVTTSAVAQDAQECIAMVSLFTEPAKAKNYQEAYKHYDNVITKCLKPLWLFTNMQLKCLKILLPMEIQLKFLT